MKKEHKEILTLIENYLEANPEQRFGQALFNLNINQFTEWKPGNNQLRDIYNDYDSAILKRVTLSLKK